MSEYAVVEIILASMASSSVAVTISWSRIFRSIRNYLEFRSSFLFDLINCPYCLGHWVAAFFFLLYFELNLLIYFSIVFLTSILSFILLYMIYKYKELTIKVSRSLSEQS